MRPSAVVLVRSLVCASLSCSALACGDTLVSPVRDDAALLDDAEGDALPTLFDVAGEALVARDVELAKLGPPYPVVMVHGFSGWDVVGPFNYFYQVRERLEAAGNDVTTPALPPYTTSDVRARVLADVIDAVLARTGKAKVHLIAHSQGGIDSRVVIASLGYASKIASLTAISTPFDGTAVADLAANAPDGLLNPAGQLLAWLIGTLGAPPDDADWASDDTSDAWTPALADSIRALTPSATRELLAHNPMPADIPFFTVAGVSNLSSSETAACAASLWERDARVDDVDPVFFATGLILNQSDGGTTFSPTPNDGLVTVASARAPESTFLGCVPADHIDEIGQIADVVGLSGWDHRGLYDRLVDNVRSLEALEQR